MSFFSTNRHPAYPLSTEKIEELIKELRADFTIAIVTHTWKKPRVYPSMLHLCIWANWSNSEKRNTFLQTLPTNARKTKSLDDSAKNCT